MRPCNPDLRRPHLPVVKSGGKVSGVVLVRIAALILLFLISSIAGPQAVAQTFQLSQAPGGLGGLQVGNNYFTSFGTMNALGIGAPVAGVTVAPLANGALYFTQYQLTAAGLPAGHKAGVTGFVSTNFLHPAALIMQSCPDTFTCNAAAQYSNMSTVAGAPTQVIPPPGIGNQTVIAGLGIFLPDNDGPSAFAGNDSVTVTLTMTDLNNNSLVGTAVIFFNSPQETVQTAVRLTLATAGGGLTITPAADYSMNFGPVNGLGFGPAAGLTTVAAAGGVVYSTPYLLQPAFGDFTSTTATIKTFVNTNFAHPTVLQLRDGAASGGPFNAIGLTAGTATQITTTAASRSTVTRFLGLFVSNVNGATAFTGNDAATMTFTLTVP
jgi:hypothetical protein